MGTTKRKKGDGRILLHVGKELFSEGSNIMLVPGPQKAQGRGVYCSEDIRMKYSGSEAFKKKLVTTPIFCIPMIGTWTRGKSKKKGGEITYHTNERMIALFDLQSFEGEIDGNSVIYHYPNEAIFFKEPDIERSGRHIVSKFSNQILEGKIDFDEAIQDLNEEYNEMGEYVEQEQILEAIVRAMNEGRIAEDSKPKEQLAELRLNKEGRERMKMNYR